jgi:hypothetical protein
MTIASTLIQQVYMMHIRFNFCLLYVKRDTIESPEHYIQFSILIH